MLLINIILNLLAIHLSGILSQSLIIIHNSNILGRYEQTARDSEPCEDEDETMICIGGMARTLTVIQEHRNMSHSGGPKVIYFNTGDTSSGTLWYTIHGWKIVAEFINLLQPDASVIGEHEFDQGMADMSSYNLHVKSPIVITNIAGYNSSLYNFRKSVIIQLGSLRIGVVGYISPSVLETYEVGSLKFANPIMSLIEETEKLHVQGIKFIVALGHAGFIEDQHIAASVPYINVIIGGHSPTFLYNGRPIDLEQPEGKYPKIIAQSSGREVAIVHAYSYGKYLGRLNITFDKRESISLISGQPILLSKKIPEDKEALMVLNKYRKEVKEAKEDVVGITRVKLDDEERVCTMQECNIGNLVTDSFVDCMADFKQNKNQWTDTAIAFLPGSAIRAGINKRSRPNFKISRASIFTVLPYKNGLSTCSLNGNDLRKVVEISASKAWPGRASKSFLQFSGIHVIYDLKKPAGSRVVSLKARCSTCQIPKYHLVEPTLIYNIVTPKYLTLGGGGYGILRHTCFNLKHYEVNDVTALTQYIKHHKIIYPHIEGRIQFVDHGTADCTGAGRIIFIVPLLMLF